jgi:CubicO group peptidase (beta-lactamase class C family)
MWSRWIDHAAQVGLSWPVLVRTRRIAGLPCVWLSLICVVLPLACGPKPAPVVPDDGARVPAVDPAKIELEKRLAYLEQTLEQARIEGHVPGMAIAVVDDGELLWAHGFGVSNLDANTPVTPETTFAIGSTTKAFSSTLAAMLVDEGKLAWDDPVTKYLPEFTLKIKSKQDEAVTIRDLLAHRSGFAGMDILWAGNTISRDEVLRYAARAKPLSRFRAEFHYNNVNYMAGALAAAQAAGSSWEDLIRTRLLEPLGMQHTSIDYASAVADPARSRGYTWREDLEIFEPELPRNTDAIAPAGSLYSSVLDMSNWLRFQLNEGELAGQRLVSAAALAETHTQQIEMAPGRGYGLGWSLSKWNDKRVVEHSGAIDGFSATVALLPEEELGLVLLTNVGTTPVQGTAKTLVFEALLTDAYLPDPESSEDLSRFVGEYIPTLPGFGGENFEVLIKDGKLAVDVPGQTIYLLKPPDPEDEQALRVLEATDTIAISFDEGPTGEIQALRHHQNGMAFELLRVGVELAPEVTPDEVAALLGHYRADKGLALEVIIHNGRLAVDVTGQMIYDLELPDKNGDYRFRINPDFIVSFQRGKNGEVEKLTQIQPGANNVFVREAGAKTISLDELHRMRKSDKRAKALAKAGVVHLRQQIQMPNAGLEGTGELWFDADGQLRHQVNFGPVGEALVVLHGVEGWSESSFDRLEPTTGIELRQATLGHPRVTFGDWRPHYASETLLRTITTKAGDQRLVVELRAEGFPISTMFIDAKTGDLVEIRTFEVDGNGMRVPVVVEYSDYRVVAGLRLPHRIETINPRSGRVITTVVAVETKLPADPSRFAPMAAIETR